MKMLPTIATSFAAAFAMVAISACSSTATVAASEHLPVIKHIKTLAFVDWTGKPYAFGTHWQALQPFVDYAIVSAHAANELSALGIKTGFYVTVHTICVPRTYGECQPDARTLPEAAFIHSCDPPYGRVMWNPEASGSNAHPFYQFLGDVHSPVLAERWNDFIEHTRHTEFGDIHFDFAFEDNSTVPGDSLSWQHYYVQGSQREQSPRPYCGYSDASFIDSELKLQNQAHIPLILNAIDPSDKRPKAALAVSYIPQSKNVIGAMLEYMYGSTINGPEREKEGDDIWRSEENSELGMVRGHKIFIGYPHNGGSDAHAIDIRGYQYASLLLGFDQRYIALAQDGPGTRSGLGLNPEIGLVAADPLVAAPNDIEGLKSSSGAYVREFAGCTIWGKPIGACATVVNPGSGEIDFPHLSQSYTHDIAISGAGVLNGVDDGRLTLMPAHSHEHVAAKGWALLAQ